MGWRRLILGLFLATTTAAVIYAWPDRPEYVIPQDNREFLDADSATRQLIFLLFDQNGSDPPVIERRDVATGRVVSAAPLDWTEVAARSRTLAGPDGFTFGSRFQISDDGSSLFWSQMSHQESYDAEHPDKSCGAVFDTTTGRRRGPLFGTDLGSWVASSPDGRWMLLRMPGSSHPLSIIGTWTGQPLVEFDYPSEDATSAYGCFSPDSRRCLFQWTSSPILYQVNLESRAIERTHRLADDTTNADNDNVWETLAEWRQGELRTHLTYCAAGTTQFFNWSFRKRTCRRPFDGVTLAPGDIDTLLDVEKNHVGPQRPPVGEGNGWVAQATSTNDPESTFSQFVDNVETWIGRGRLVNWNGRYGGRTFVRIIDRATNAIRYEIEEMSGNIRVVLDGQYVLRPVYTPVYGFEVWRTDVWPRWIWAAVGGIGMFAAIAFLPRFMRGRFARKNRQLSGDVRAPVATS